MRITAKNVFEAEKFKKAAYFRKKAMNIIEYAEMELTKAGVGDSDADYGGMLKEAVLELLHVFAEQGHSGYSAASVLQLFSKLADYKPLGPLTGEADEWFGEDSNFPLGDSLQNKRCFSVFKNKKTGEVYDTRGKIFRDKNGGTYTSSDSHVPVTFPYYPNTEIVDVAE